jgi:hypothetical protein
MHGVGNDPTYNAGSCFENFPFPAGLTPNLLPRDYACPHSDEVASAAIALDSYRNQWLNPTDWTDRRAEVMAGYPDVIVPKPAHEAELKKRTLTNLYNVRPAWLDNAHKALDAAAPRANMM